MLSPWDAPSPAHAFCRPSPADSSLRASSGREHSFLSVSLSLHFKWLTWHHICWKWVELLLAGTVALTDPSAIIFRMAGSKAHGASDAMLGGEAVYV